MQQLVVANDANPVSLTGVAAGRDGRRHSPFRFFAARLGVVTHVLVEFAEHTRRVPHFSNGDAFCEIAIPLAMIEIRVCQDQVRQVGPAITLRKLGNQLIDHWAAFIVGVLGNRAVVEINLHYDHVTNHDGGAVAATNRPKHKYRSPPNIQTSWSDLLSRNPPTFLGA